MTNKKNQADFLPNLRIVNGVSINVTDLFTRGREKRTIKMLNDLAKHANHYSFGNQEPCWYIQDEVGSTIGHSDWPNLK